MIPIRHNDLLQPTRKLPTRPSQLIPVYIHRSLFLLLFFFSPSAFMCNNCNLSWSAVISLATNDMEHWEKAILAWLSPRGLAQSPAGRCNHVHTPHGLPIVFSTWVYISALVLSSCAKKYGGTTRLVARRRLWQFRKLAFLSSQPNSQSPGAQ